MTMYITLGLGAFAVGAAVWAVVEVGTNISDAVIAGAAVATGLATVFVARFTGQLTDVTRQVREDADASTKGHLAELAEHRKVMAAQQRAMEAQSETMGALARAARDSADLTERMLLSAYPPDLIIQNAGIAQAGDGSCFIHFGIKNRGNTAAVIEACFTMDIGLANALATTQDHTALRGFRIERHDFAPVEHPCKRIRAADLEDAETRAAIRFQGAIFYKDESGAPLETRFVQRLDPKWARFVDAPPNNDS